MNKSGERLVEKAESARALTQNQTKEAPHGTDVLHRPGRSQEKGQLLRKGRDWPDLGQRALSQQHGWTWTLG
jgi:hypothetical protein